MTQVVRLIVLFEDLKVELNSLALDRNLVTDECGSHFRQMYFLRRAFATLDEMQQAFHKLNKLAPIKAIRRQFHPEQEARWDKTVKFFSANQKFLSSQSGKSRASVRP